MVHEQGSQIEAQEQVEVAFMSVKPSDGAVPRQEEVVVAAAENGGSENGHPPAEDHKQEVEGAVGESGTAEANGDSIEEELWRKRLWFVRIPKPAEVGAIKALEQELETYRAQHKLLSESFNVKKVERDAARDNTRAAREAFKVCREAFEAKRAIVQPMREAQQTTSGEAKKLRESFSDLDVKSEEELDDRLQQLHYRIEHESIPLNEEKRILQQIKKLESQRAKVREYEVTAGALAESRSEVKRLEGELQEHKGELQALLGEKNLQWTILEKFREQEAVVDKEVEEILTERKRIKDILDEAYQRVSELKGAQKAKNDEYYGNRRFSYSIRELLNAGKLDEAREQCAEQMEAAHAKLNSDPEYRAEYFALWELQRKSPVSMAALDDADADLPAPKGGRPRRQEQQQPAVDPGKKAQQVIAAVLEEAKEEFMRVKAAAASAAAAAAQAPEVVEQSLAPPEPAEPEPAAKPAPKAPRPRQVAKHLVEVPVIPEVNFELPEAIKAKKGPSVDELKALEREQNRAMQLEAEKRKQKKVQEAEKKRQRALREQQEAAAKAKQAAANPVPVEPEIAPEQSGEEGAAGEGAVGLPAAAEASAVQPTAAGKAAVAKASKVTAITSRPKPTAKRPANVKKPLLKQLRSLWKDNEGVVALAVIAIVVLVMFVMYLTTSNKAVQA